MIVLVIAFVLRVAVVAEAQTRSPDALNAARDFLSGKLPDMIRETVQGMMGQIWPSLEQRLPQRQQSSITRETARFSHATGAVRNVHRRLPAPRASAWRSTPSK